uniref:K Homology domain-containing protein n=1 Tax=Ditylenchus dipsaci TaxID=166011 RepID=A0A915CTK1_9BILA
MACYEMRQILPAFPGTTQVGGAVIGKGGENVRTIGQKYNASISINDRNTAERVLSIIAKQDVIVDCVRDILPTFTKINPSKEAEVRKLVHRSHVGLIIGSKGASIKELKETTKTFINIYKEVCPNSTDRVVQINGSVDGVVRAVAKLIEELVKHPLTNPEQTYDAVNYDASLVPLYGGFLSPLNNQNMQFDNRPPSIYNGYDRALQHQQFYQTPGKHNIYMQQPHHTRDQSPLSIDRYGGYGHQTPRATYEQRLAPRSPSHPLPANRSKSCVGGPAATPIVFSEDFLQNQEQSTVHMGVPKDKIDRVIGVNGEVLNHIMQDVGVAIDLSITLRAFGLSLCRGLTVASFSSTRYDLQIMTKDQVHVATMIIKERAQHKDVHQINQQSHRPSDPSLMMRGAANETGYGHPGGDAGSRDEYVNNFSIQED